MNIVTTVSDRIYSLCRLRHLSLAISGEKPQTKNKLGGSGGENADISGCGMSARNQPQNIIHSYPWFTVQMEGKIWSKGVKEKLESNRLDSEFPDQPVEY